eukprot:11630940-Alexandrium_andersonii.AAC.1
MQGHGEKLGDSGKKPKDKNKEKAKDKATEKGDGDAADPSAGEAAEVAQAVQMAIRNRCPSTQAFREHFDQGCKT